jgi:hypothetical protein
MQQEKMIGDAHCEKLETENGTRIRNEEQNYCGRQDEQHPRTPKIRDYPYEEWKLGHLEGTHQKKCSRHQSEYHLKPCL